MAIVPAVSVAVPMRIRLLSFASFVVAAHFLDVVAPDIVVLLEHVLYLAVVNMTVLIDVIGYETDVDFFFFLVIFSFLQEVLT